MIGLKDFPPPNLGEETTCEFNNHLISCSTEGLPISSKLAKYKPSLFNNESLRLSANRDIGDNSFMPIEETLSRRTIRAWNENGIMGIMEELNESEENNLVCKVAKVLMQAYCYSKKGLTLWKGIVSPHYMIANETMCNRFSHVRDWSDGIIRCFAWHPQTFKFAICFKDDSIHVYSDTSKIKPLLRHKLQKNVIQMAWKPFCSTILAVACENGAFIWYIDPTSLLTRPSSSYMALLKHKSQCPITSLVWHPNGSLLATASVYDTSMYIWDISTEKGVPLTRLGGGGVSMLKWSPDGRKLLAATPSSNFRIWDTEKWDTDCWDKLQGHCQAACWNPESDVLLFVCSSILYCISFGSSTFSSSNASLAVPIADLSAIILDNDVAIGGEVFDIAMDKRGERLAIVFKENTSFIAVFRTSFNPTVQVAACGFIQGPPREMAQCINFHDHFDEGALLTVCWSSGKVTHIPFMFKSNSTAVTYIDLNAQTNIIQSPTAPRLLSH